MSRRVFLIPRTGDGSAATPFAPNVPEGVDWWGYTVGTKFLVATEQDLTAYGTEITLASAIRAAAALYGITPQMIGRDPNGTPLPTATRAALKQIAVLVAHAPVALAHRAAAKVKSVLA